jgi:hypothetical protein
MDAENAELAPAAWFIRFARLTSIRPRGLGGLSLIGEAVLTAVAANVLPSINRP